MAPKMQGSPADVKTARGSLFFNSRDLHLYVIVYDFTDGHTQVGDVGVFAFLLQLFVDGLDGILSLFHFRSDILAVKIFP